MNISKISVCGGQKVSRRGIGAKNGAKKGEGGNKYGVDHGAITDGN